MAHVSRPCCAMACSGISNNRSRCSISCAAALLPVAWSRSWPATPGRWRCGRPWNGGGTTPWPRSTPDPRSGCWGCRPGPTRWRNSANSCAAGAYSRCAGTGCGCSSTGSISAEPTWTTPIRSKWRPRPRSSSRPVDETPTDSSVASFTSWHANGESVTAVLLVAAGLALLIIGAEVLVRGAAALAGALGIPPVVVGLTVVSVGTSAPELAIGIDSAINDAGPLAVGNIAGTNIVNLLLILGLSAAIAPLAIAVPTIRRDLPIMAAVGLLLLALTWDGTLGRIDGAILLAVAAGYTMLIVVQARRDPIAARIAEEEVPAAKGRAWVHLLLTVVGLAVIVVGADLLV